MPEKKKSFAETLAAGIGAVLEAAASNAATTSRHEALKEVIEIRRAEVAAADRAYAAWKKANPNAGFWASLNAPDTYTPRRALEQAKQDLVDFATGRTRTDQEA